MNELTTFPSFLLSKGLLLLSVTFCFNRERTFKLGSEAGNEEKKINDYKSNYCFVSDTTDVSCRTSCDPRRAWRQRFCCPSSPAILLLLIQLYFRLEARKERKRAKKLQIPVLFSFCLNTGYPLIIVNIVNIN